MYIEILLIGAIIMKFGNIPILDPILSICVAIFILIILIILVKIYLTVILMF